MNFNVWHKNETSTEILDLHTMPTMFSGVILEQIPLDDIIEVTNILVLLVNGKKTNGIE